MGHGGDQQDDDQRGEQPGDHERQEGQLEDVEADVGVELRVLHTEVDAVDEQQPLVPLAGDSGPGDDGEQEGHARPDPAGAVVDDVVVAPEQVLFGTHGREPGSDAVSDDQVGEAEDEEDPDEDPGQGDLGPQDRAEGVRLAQGVEPQVIGVEAGDASQRGDQEEQADRDQDEDDAAPRRESALAATARRGHV